MIRMLYLGFPETSGFGIAAKKMQRIFGVIFGLLPKAEGMFQKAPTDQMPGGWFLGSYFENPGSFGKFVGLPFG